MATCRHRLPLRHPLCSACHPELAPRPSCSDLVAALEAVNTPLAARRGRVLVRDPKVAPAAFNADGSAVCLHRDLTVCPDCRRGDVAYVEVHGAVYWIPNPVERAELLTLLAEEAAL